MTVFPAPGTRISVPLQTQRLLSQLNADQTAIQANYDQLSTGRRIQRIGDDPVAASRAIGLQGSIRYGEQLVRNADEANSFYAATDETLARIGNALIEARGAAVSAAQNVLPDEERESIAIGIRQTLDQILSAGNATFRDHQVLSGILQTGPSFVQESNTVLFNGNDATGQTRSADGIRLETSVGVRDALGSSQPIVQGEPLQAAVDRDTRLVDVRGGRGVQTGVIRVSDGSGWQEVDLRSAATIGDIKDVLESLDLNGRQLAVTLQNDGFRVEYVDGLPGVLAIDDMPGGKTAADLNIENPDGLSPPPLIAESLTPSLTLTSKLSQLNNGAGLDVAAGLRIQQGDETFTVDLREAETLGDVMIAINRSDADLRAVLDPSGRIDIQALRAGVDYSIGENGGQAATALGIRSATEDTTLASLGHGQGILTDPTGPELTILRPDGTQLDLDFESLETIGDVLDAINSHPNNQDTRRVIASLAASGNGIQLIAPPTGTPITVRQPSGGTAGRRLGLIPAGANEASGTPLNGTASFVGQDYSKKEPGGAVDSLIRLEAAVRAGDIREIGRLQQQLDGDLDRSVSVRGRVGVLSQNLEILRNTAADQVVTLNSQLSDAVDTDFAQVISDMNLRQTALQATMQLIGQTSQLSVLNFL